VKKIENTEKI